MRVIQRRSAQIIHLLYLVVQIFLTYKRRLNILHDTKRKFLSIQSGATALGGKIPVNPSGGLLSLGHPLAASGTRVVGEVALHLRGQAGKRQVPNAKVGIAQMLGGMDSGLEAGAAGVHILTI